MKTLTEDLNINLLIGFIGALSITLVLHIIFGLINQIVDINNLVSIRELWTIIPLTSFVSIMILATI